MPAHNSEVIVFLVAANLIVVGLAIFFFFLLRIQHKRKILHRQELLKQEFKTREDTIRGISRDLHDEIGSSLSGINIFTQMAAEQLRNNNPGAASGLIDSIKGYTESVIEKTGDLVWMLQPENDTQERMIQRLKVFSQSIARAKQIRLSFETEAGLAFPDNRLLFRKNIYLICKEAINNAVKYSESATLTVRFTNQGILIEDDGKGFDHAMANPGHGLQNMKQRASEVNVKLVIETLAGSGTKVKLMLNG